MHLRGQSRHGYPDAWLHLKQANREGEQAAGSAHGQPAPTSGRARLGSGKGRRSLPRALRTVRPPATAQLCGPAPRPLWALGARCTGLCPRDPGYSRSLGAGWRQV